MAKSLLQTKEWASLRQGYGWQAHQIDDIFVLEKKLPFSKSFLYAPEVNFEDIKNFDIFKENVQKIAEKNNSIFFRLEILNENDEKIIEKLKTLHFIKAFEEIQPEYRQIIPIDKTLEEILAGMKQKGRYNIKIAQKNSIQVEKSEKIDDFYQLFLETAKRDGFSIRPRKYFEDLLNILENSAELLIAYYQGKPIAAEIVTYFDGVASYLYGASASVYRNLMAPYLLHFEAMKRAKEKGCIKYDLLAVAPISDQQSAISNQTSADSGSLKAESHKYAGITRFKQQFGGETVCLIGGWDLVFKPTWYRMFKMAEKIRRK